jgi:hypothetical protein
MVISVPASDKSNKSDTARSSHQLMSRLTAAAPHHNSSKAMARAHTPSAEDRLLEDERGFLELQACIPHLAESKTASRLDILLEAINYIDILHTTLIHKIHRGGGGQVLSGEERRRVLAQYLANMVQESNKEN